MKTSETLALDILRDIVQAGLKPGDRLPLEPEMVLRYGVSRPTLREAMRLLEFQGLIAIRPGRGAGTVVGAARAQNLAQMLVLYFHQASASYEELLSAWQTTEPLLARLAAQNPDRARVRSAMKPFLKPAAQETRDHAVEFHEVLAGLTDNKVLSLMCHAVGHIADRQLMEEGLDECAGEFFWDHANIAQAVHDGDDRKAAQLMAEHVARIIAHYRAHWPQMVGERRWL